MKYIHELPDWPNLHWNDKKLSTLLGSVRHKQGILLGRMYDLGFDTRSITSLETLAVDIVKSSEIEGEILDRQQVRSSLAKKLGLDIGGLAPANRYVEGVVEMTLNATEHYNEPLTKNRLCDWHSLLFPKDRSSIHKIIIGNWRSPEAGKMQVVSGSIGHERVHFEAPEAERLENEMRTFLNWFNHTKNIDPLLKAGIAHFWFVTIHPFEDGNGRIARAIADMCLAQADGIHERFYGMSASIERERKGYYAALEFSQKHGLDITQWLEWFLTCLSHAIENAEAALKKPLLKTRIWQYLIGRPINSRQHKIINLLTSDFRGKLTTGKYAKIAKCSHDTALRDIQTLIEYGIILKAPGGGRSTSYLLNLDI